MGAWQDLDVAMEGHQISQLSSAGTKCSEHLETARDETKLFKEAMFCSLQFRSRQANPALWFFGRLDECGICCMIRVGHVLRQRSEE